jgi:predicted nucleic acid-binding protein
MVMADPDDDAVLACAFAARVDVIISGDGHLLSLPQDFEFRIVMRNSVPYVVKLKTQ